MRVDTIIKVFSIVLAVLILLGTLYAPVYSILSIITSRSLDTLLFLEDALEIVKSKCPIIVLGYLAYVFYARGSTAGVTRKTGFVVLGACGIGLAVNVVYFILMGGITMDLLTSAVCIIYSAAIWVFCAAVNTAVQEKKNRA